MKSIRLAKTAIAVNAALCLSAGITMPAFSATEVEVENKAQKEKIEIIEVTGIRGSLRDNLNNKRFSDVIVDSINTEDIAKNPDKNMAEALQRVAGVQITRQFGEGSKVSIRGTSPELTNTLVNGQSAKSASYLPGQSESNAFDFSNIPAERVSKIEVYKSARADIDAGGIGGTVILHTKKPLEQENGYGYLNVEGEYNDSSEKTSPQISTAYNFVSENEKFGASISVSLQERNSFRSGFESGGLGGGTGFQQTDAIDCPTEACASSDIKLRHMNNHALIVTRHMALNGYTYGDLENVAGNGDSYWPTNDPSNSGVWNNSTHNWGQLNEVMDPTYIDPTWGLFWGSRRGGGLGQTAPRVLGNSVYSPAFEKQEKRLDTTLNLQWAPSDELSFNLELNRNKSDRDNKSDNLFAQPLRIAQYLYSNEVQGIDPRLVMDAERDIVLSATGPIDGAWLVGRAGSVWDGTNPDYNGGRQAKWGELLRRESHDRAGSETEQDRIHLTVDYEVDAFIIKLQAGQTTADSTALDRATTLGTRYGDYDTPYSGDQNDVQIPSYEGVNLGYGYNPDTGKVYWGVEADPSLTGDALAAAQQRASNFLLAPTNEFYLMNLSNSERYRENTENFFQGDVTWVLDNDFYIDSVKFGAKYRDVKRTQSYFTESARFHNFADQSSDFPTILAEQVVGGTVSGLDTAGHDTPDEYFDIDQAKRDALFNSHFLTLPSEGAPNKGGCADAIAASGSSEYYGCTSGLTESAGSAYEVSEELFAYYAMVNFSGERFRGNFGVRVVDTERESIGNEVAKDENGQPLSYPLDPNDANYIAELAGFNQYTPLVQTSSTIDYLPSFNLSYDLTDTVILRAAASKNISHPSLTQMRSNFSLVTERTRLYTDGRQQDLTPEGNAERLAMDSQRRGAVGNPNLGSFSSINSEIGVEWYFDESSIFSITAFQKDITNMVRSTEKVQDLTYLGDEGRTDNNGYPVFGDYVVSSYFNTGEQKVKGVELQLQHDFGNGFGGLINYTYTDVPDQEFSNSSFTYEVADLTDIETHVSDPSQRDYYEVTGFSSMTTSQQEPMFGQSEDTLNASVYFENTDFSVRLSYNYRSEFANKSNGEGIQYTDARSQLDFKATYQIMDNLVASFSVTNLTDENVVYYLESSQIVTDPVINKMKWIDEVDENGISTGNRIVATDDNGVGIIESSVTGDAAFDILAQASGVSVDELKPYYENRLNKIYVNEWTNGRRFYIGLNYTF